MSKWQDLASVAGDLFILSQTTADVSEMAGQNEVLFLMPVPWKSIFTNGF
ncbi:hypothetical protein [Bacillus massiliglaciei]|nr:hypothetical protein [Bacillus massiliglaciei]